MTNWQEDNLSAILEYPFDFDRYIAQQLRHIDNLDERKFAKQVLVEGFGRMIHQTEAKYKELENRVYQEIDIPNNRYEVVTTVAARKYYDPTNGTLFPVIPFELKREICREELSTQGLLYVGTLFVRGNRQECREFASLKNISGTLHIGTEEKETRYQFQIRKAVRYTEAVEELYRTFMDNHIPWETVNIGFLGKFYDLFLPMEGLYSVGGKLPEFPELEEVNLRLEQYEGIVRKGVIPLWNIDPIVFDSKNFMIPCIDGIYYEHEFKIEEGNRGDGYLIRMQEDILEIRHVAEKIIIKSKEETFKGWGAVRMVQDQTVRSLDYEEPFLSNRKKDSFIKRYANRSGVNLMTRTELFRKIMELEIDTYIEIVDYEILDNGRGYPAQESMNWFMGDELFPQESRRILLLKFKEINPGHYLNDSMMWFVVSHIQMDISEYRCVAILMKD